MSQISLFPFNKLCWRTKAIANEWEPIRRRIYNCTAFAEYEMVKRGYRRCDVYDFGPNNIIPRLTKVAADGLFFIPILISKQYGGYGHRHYTTDKFTDDTFIYGGVAKDCEDAIAFHDAGVPNIKDRIMDPKKTKYIYHDDMIIHSINPDGIDHRLTGWLLGYPACDVEFFSRTWLKDGCLDPMYEMAVNTEGAEVENKVFIKDNSLAELKPKEYNVKVAGNPMLNRLARYWGFNIVPHFPHSFDCVEAGDFAEVFFKLMREADGEAADACLDLLSMPMRWSMMNAVTTLEHPLFFGSANGYYRKEKVTVEWFPI